LNRYFSHIFLAFFFGMAMNLSNAQKKQLRAYTVEDGLPQSQVFDIVQDDMGYLWLGTQGGGLCSFDGDSFQVWNENDGLSSNYIHALHALNDTIYVGSKRGLSIKVRNGFINVESPQINRFYFSGTQKYLATKRGVYELSNDNNLKKVKINSEIDESSINDVIYENSFFWLATSSGFWKLSDLNSNAKTLEKLETNNFTAVVAFEDTIYAATFNDGTLIYDIDDLEHPILMREPLRINAMSIQNKKELWIATDNDGISIIDPKTNTEKALINTNNGLAVPHIRKVIADKQSNIWIATSGWGFYKYYQNNFQHFNKNTGLKGNRVYAVHNAKNGLWVSSSEAGLAKIDDEGIHHIPGYKTFSEVKIKTIASDKKGNIWAGSDGRGLLFRETKTVDSIIVDSSDVFDVKQEKISKTVIRNHVLNSDTGFPYNWIIKTHVEGNTVWAATYSSGIVKFDYYAEKDSLAIRRTFGAKDGIKDLLIKDMVKDDQGRLWYATRNGHLGYVKEGNVNHLGAVLNLKVQIGTLLFKNNTLFIGTAGRGVWWTETNDGSNFKKLKGVKKLYSENIYQLIFDDEGYLWVGTERGVDRVTLDKDNDIVDVFHFGRNDGFLGIETCLNAVDKDTNGNLWFGAIYGLTQFVPSESSKEVLKPKIHFKDVEIAYRSVDSIDLKLWTNTDKVLELSPKQRQVSFKYKTVDLDHPTDIQYRYMLNETKWSPWSMDPAQNFSGLAYGSHKFTVQSRNNRWEMSDPIDFKFHIDSPLYEKTWFQWTIIVLAIALLGLYALRYIRRMKLENNAEQERLKLQNHLLTLEQKALRLQMNPHFIFNVLNGIKAMAGTKPEKMNATINNFATLLRETLINSRKDTISLDQEIKTLRHYIEVEKLMAPSPFDYEVIVNSDLNPEEILVPPMLIQPFVENAIRHGILKGRKAGVLKVQFDTDEEYLQCTVLDNGIGIFQSQQSKPKTDHQSMALTVTRERLESISGKEALQIAEIKNNDGTIGGTNIIFKIPLETDY